MVKLCHTQHTAMKRSQIEASLLQLLSSGSYPDISVKDICVQAGIPRRTFYHYFENKEDVLTSIIDNLVQQSFLEALLDLLLNIDDLKQSFVRVFRFWDRDNRAILDSLIRNGLESRLMARATQFLRTEQPPFLTRRNLEPKLLEVSLMAGVNTFFSLLFYWSRGNYQETPEQMAAYAVCVLPQVFSNS